MKQKLSRVDRQAVCITELHDVRIHYVMQRYINEDSKFSLSDTDLKDIAYIVAHGIAPDDAIAVVANVVNNEDIESVKESNNRLNDYINLGQKMLALDLVKRLTGDKSTKATIQLMHLHGFINSESKAEGKDLDL